MGYITSVPECRKHSACGGNVLNTFLSSLNFIQPSATNDSFRPHQWRRQNLSVSTGHYGTLCLNLPRKRLPVLECSWSLLPSWGWCTFGTTPFGMIRLVTRFTFQFGKARNAFEVDGSCFHLLTSTPSHMLAAWGTRREMGWFGSSC